ncbi:MAG: putative bifunctional diguanylate cyclase/phosphodiesterase [Roseobacter sp.]
MLAIATAALHQTRLGIHGCLSNPIVLACVPAACLGLFWVAGERALMTMAFAFPILFLSTYVQSPTVREKTGRVPVTGKMNRETFKETAKDIFASARASGLKSATYQIEIDDFDAIVDRYGQSATEKLAETVFERLTNAMREEDAVAQSNDSRFAITLGLVKRLDLELCIQVAGRVQAALEEPFSIDGTTVYITSCVGFCQNTKVMTDDYSAWLQASGHALREAQLHGPGAIRAYSEEMRRKTKHRSELRYDLANALESGQIQAWFQPQISTDTGYVTGFEALARWNHPKRGMIPPNMFLPAVEEAGLLEQLAETMMHHAFTALKAWDNAGAAVPQVGVNFAGPELSNPRLVEKVKWELDRFDLTPDRLAVEVLETVVAGAPDDTITRNINLLGELGCRIDLDDFGTGHASISSIRRFSVSRIKIDRSFVLKADKDPEQQRMISAILTMAERLEVETLAEGVESVGEHALLAQLGCTHVQGFGIGKPMPFHETLDWMKNHNAKLQDAAQIFGNKSR